MIKMKNMEWSSIPVNRRGDLAEIFAAAWLVSKGYEVFPNAFHTGKADMIAYKGDEIIFIDVGLIKKNYAGRYNDNKKKKADQSVCGEYKIKILYVLETGECVWRDDLFLDK